MNHQQVVFVSMLVALLTTGLLPLNSSTMFGNEQAQMYGYEYRYDNNYNNDYLARMSTHKDIQKIKSANST